MEKIKVLLGLTGSVATTLAPKMVKYLSQKYDLKIVITESANKFAVQFDNPVPCYRDRDEWEWRDDSLAIHTIWRKNDPVLHIDLRDWADVLVIAPLSANTLAKMANGICDNLLTSIVRAWRREKPMVIAPAMNTAMWESPFTKEHIGKLSVIYDLKVAWPVKKKLVCGEEGIGAMAQLDTIYKEIDNA